MAGYEDVNDAERLSRDPTFRLISSEKIWERAAALTSRSQSFETKLLTQAKNLVGLAAINREFIAKLETIDSPQLVVLDMDSTEIPENRSTVATTGITNQLVITRCCSTGKAKMTRLSCHRFRSNEVRLWLKRSLTISGTSASVASRNRLDGRVHPGNLWRRLALPKRIEN